MMVKLREGATTAPGEISGNSKATYRKPRKESLKALLQNYTFFLRTSKNQVKLKIFLGFLRGVKLDIKNVLKIQCIFKKKSK